MSDYISGFMYGRMLSQNPHLMQNILRQQQYEQEQKQAIDLASALSEAIGIDATGNADAIQQPTNAPQNSTYDGQYADLINAAAQKFQLSPNEIASTIRHESNFNPNAISPTGPQGLMQLSEAAAKDVGLDPSERLDPAKNIMAGSAYLKRMKDEFGDKYRLAYHDGPQAVRDGNISKEGLDYAAKFADDMQSTNVLPEYQNTSRFQPNPVAGGRGLLGQDMDPVRRSYLHTIKQLVDSKNPLAIQMAAELFKEMQSSSLKDIERTADQKNITMLGLDPTSDSYRNIAKQMLLKPSGTNINIGDGQFIRPATSDEKKAWGLPDNVPASTNLKTGEVKATPLGTTEDQGKSAQYAGGLITAYKNLDAIMSGKDMNPVSSANNAKDYVGTILEESGVPIASTVGIAMQSDEQQKFNQASKEAKVHIIHALTGGGYSAQEAEEKSAAYLPRWGEGLPARINKQKSLLTELESLAYRAGGAIRPETSDAIKALREEVDSKQTKPERKVVRTGKRNGVRVVQYDDGSIEEAP